MYTFCLILVLIVPITPHRVVLNSCRMVNVFYSSEATNHVILCPDL